MVLTPDASLIPVVQGLARRLAENLGFEESQRLHLQQGLEHACRKTMRSDEEDGEDLHLGFTAFADRIEIVVEDDTAGLEASEPDAYLLSQLVDRVVFDDSEEGKTRLTLVQYTSGAGGAS